MNKKVLKVREISHNAHNLAEKQLKRVLKDVIIQNPNWGWEQISVQDVYACAINKLPALYVRKGEEREEPIPRAEIEKAIKFAMYRVAQNPIHSSLS